MQFKEKALCGLRERSVAGWGGCFCHKIKILTAIKKLFIQYGGVVCVGIHYQSRIEQLQKNWMLNKGPTICFVAPHCLSQSRSVLWAVKAHISPTFLTNHSRLNFLWASSYSLSKVGGVHSKPWSTMHHQYWTVPLPYKTPWIVLLRDVHVSHSFLHDISSSHSYLCRVDT